MRIHPTAASRLTRFRFLAALTVTMAAPGAAHAQSSLTVAAGPSLYDLSGTGTGVVGAVRYEITLSELIVFELGSALFRYETQAGSKDNLILPEIGLRLVFPLGSMRGYIGAGAGAHVTLRQDRDAELTLFGSVGLDIELSEGWAVRPEARLRSIDPWVGSTLDLTIGISRTLGD